MRKTIYIIMLTGYFICIPACQAEDQKTEIAPSTVAAVPVVSREAEKTRIQAYEAEELAAAQRDLQKEVLKAREEVHEAHARLKSSGVNVTVPGLDNFYFPFGSPSGSMLPVLLIPNQQTEARILAQLSEDMQVMSLILQEAVHPDMGSMNMIKIGGRSGRGIRMYGRGFSQEPKATYLEGYGMTFEVKVDYPLLLIGGSEPKEREKEPEGEDKVWKQSRNKLKGVEDPGEAPDTGEKVIYDPAQVGELKKRIIEVLRHASNIRNLKASDRIAIVVSGCVDGEIVYLPVNSGAEEDVSVPTSMMILQVLKRDIDRFASGAADLEEFTKQVSVLIY